MASPWRRVDPEYGYTVPLGKIPLAEARERVGAALKDEGFGILTEIDVEATLKQKIGKEVAPYRILGACNPNLAARALETDPGVGLLLPCNVCLWEDERGAVASFAKPSSMFSVLASPEALAPVAEEAAQRIRRAAEKLAGHPLAAEEAAR